MKYRIEYPLKKDCNLHCEYCFHQDYFQNKNSYENGKRYDLGFTMEEWQKWRDKFLFNAKEILISPHGGETFNDVNTELLLNLIQTNKDSIQTYEFLSNGLPPVSNYKEICIPFKSIIQRIGFTYHRHMMNDTLSKQFEQTVIAVRDLGIPVYIKELLIMDYKEDILNNVEYWKNKGIEVKIQDFKGFDKGQDGSEYKKYTEEDRELIDKEYRHLIGQYCTCKEGYKSIAIFGYDESRGFVVACWRDKKIVGNISQMWFNPNFKVDRVIGTSKRNVIGIPSFYLEHDASFYFNE